MHRKPETTNQMMHGMLITNNGKKQMVRSIPESFNQDELCAQPVTVPRQRKFTSSNQMHSPLKDETLMHTTHKPAMHISTKTEPTGYNDEN